MIYPTINRSLLLVQPKQPFYNWSNALTPDLEAVQPSDVTDYNTYLLEDELFLNDIKKELAPYWRHIFENELYGQWTDESAYPKLTWKLFTEWFDLKKSSIISDLTTEPLYSEHYE